MFGIKMSDVQSCVDKRLASEVAKLGAKLQGITAKNSNLQGKVTTLENKVATLIRVNVSLARNLHLLEEHLKIELVEEEVVGYKKVTTNKKK
jgi:uncharacterized protein (DUF3084 family)